MSSFTESLFKGIQGAQQAGSTAALTSLGVPPKVAATAAKIDPSRQFYKGIKKAQNWIGKVIGRKKDKAEARLEIEKQKLAQLEALQQVGTRSGADYKTSPLQAAVFGPAPDEKKGFRALDSAVPSSLLNKFGNSKTDKMEKTKMWLSANWMYLVGGLAVLYLLMGKKRR